MTVHHGNFVTNVFTLIKLGVSLAVLAFLVGTAVQLWQNDSNVQNMQELIQQTGK